jgi:polyhydroxybutyrate depolymerase
MAFVLSCTLSDRIAAVGMVSAGLDPQWGWCLDHRPVPVIAFHGTADPVFPYNGGWSKLGGATFPSVPDFMANWSRRNQCRLLLTMRTWCSVRSREKAISGPAGG